MLEAITISDECPLLNKQDRGHPQPLLFLGKRNSLYVATDNKNYYSFIFLSEPCHGAWVTAKLIVLIIIDGAVSSYRPLKGESILSEGP